MFANKTNIIKYLNYQLLNIQNMKKISVLTIAVIMAVNVTNLFAQRTTDIPGGEDYPLVSRFEGSVIEYYKVTKWDNYKLPVFDNNISKPDYKHPLNLEGKIIRIQYSVAPDNNPAYVMKNYEKAFKSKGYKILLEGKPGEDFEEGPASFQGDYYGSQHDLNLEKFGFAYNPIGNHKAIIVAKTHKDNNDVYIVDVISDFSNTTLITQDVIEVEAAETGKVTAASLDKDLSANGHIAIYDIHFDTGKSEIKPGSEDALKNIAAYLNAHTGKQFLIVGHTDNAGDFDANVKLSEDRAVSVKNTLVRNYNVKADQLKTFGAGPVAPVATNATEEGKAKNRRVEIVAL